MIRVRPFAPADLGALPARAAECIASLWRAGESRPEWTFAAVGPDGRLLARGAYWALPSSPREVALAALDYESLAAARALVCESAARMRAAGATSIECRIDSARGPVEERAALLEEAGFARVQEKDRLVREGPLSSPDPGASPAPARLVFRTRAEVGDDAFVHAIRRVTEGTLDRDDRRSILERGLEAGARAYFDVLRDLDDRPEWWALACLPGGRAPADPPDPVGLLPRPRSATFSARSLAGLVVPQRIDGLGGAVNYVGVVPEYRGRRYSSDLIARALAVLAAAGVPRVIADVDRENVPMRRAFERAGFAPASTFVLYRA